MGIETSAELRPLRKWQAEAMPLIEAWLNNPTSRPVVRAIMGAGKSEVIKRVASMAAERMPVVVATSRERLVRQLHAELGAGVFFGKKKAPSRITVTTYNSAAALSAHIDPGALLICDECHRTDNARMGAALEAMAPAAMLGFTATPARLSRWSGILYDYSARQALADGVVVGWVAHPWVSDSDEPVPVDDACLAMTKEAVEIGPTLVNAKSIDDAIQFANKLDAIGVRAMAIHSKLSEKQANSTLESLRTGAIQALVHVDMLTEGADFPWLRCLVMRRQVASMVRFAQEVGRVLRAHKGKENAHLFDPHGLLDLFSLDFDAVFASQDVVESDDEKAEREEAAARLEVERFIASYTAMSALVKCARLAWQQVGGWPSDTLPGRNWRAKEATEKQVSGLSRMAWVARQRGAPKLLPTDRKALKAICEYATAGRRYSRGEVADILALFHVVASGKMLFPENARPTAVELAKMLGKAVARGGE